MDNIELQDSISTILAGIDRPRAFVTSVERSCPLLDLAVNGVGTISLPLLSVQAEAISQIAARAPYGRGDQTLVHTDVRRVWRVSPERLSMDDSSMGPVLAETLAPVHAGLGLHGEIGAEFYKLLIYDEGSCFLTS